MPNGILDRAAGLAKDIHNARRAGPLKEMAAEFIQLVESLPDFPVGEVTADEIRRVTADAEQVIEKIEQWIDKGRVEDTDEQQLASAVYEIRDAIEQIHHWRRHYLGA